MTLILTAADVRAVFDMPAAIESQRNAFRALGSGTARLAPRVLVEGEDSITFSYASRLSPESGAVAKFGNVNPGNAARGLPSVSALVIVQDAVDGTPAAIIEGESVTTLRTSAASAVAVDHLAPPDAGDLAVIGCGVQAKAHVHALAQARTLRRIRIHAPREAQRAAAAEELGAASFTAEAMASAAAAVDGADLVVTATTSPSPVVHGEWLAPGCTVVSVGSFAPDRCEVDAAVLSRAAAVVVDHAETARQQAGPVVLHAPDEIIELGEVVTGAVKGRRGPDEIVFYNSVGVGLQDAAAAAVIVRLARENNIGMQINL